MKQNGGVASPKESRVLLKRVELVSTLIIDSSCSSSSFVSFLFFFLIKRFPALMTLQKLLLRIWSAPYLVHVQGPGEEEHILITLRLKTSRTTGLFN